MTLVLTVTTPEFLVQVSDRRLTLQTGELVTDDATKAVAYCNFMAVSYTGLAKIQGERTDLWIARHLQQVQSPSPGRAAAKLRESAEAVFRALPSLHRHAFIGVGWLSESGDDDLHPFVAKVSNFHDEEGTRLGKPRAEFTAKIDYTARKDLFALDATGQRLRRAEIASLRRNIRRGLGRSAKQQSVMRLLANQIREVADRNQRVGRDLLAICYPRGAAQENTLEPSYIIKGSPRGSSASFHDLRDGNTGGRMYQPHIVVPGFQVSDIQLEGPKPSTGTDSPD